MWWNGSWFQGIRYTWNEKGTQIRNSFPEAGDKRIINGWKNIIVYCVNSR
jgi:hypothetical protein